MKLSVIIPVYNEKDTIHEIIDKVRAVPLNKEIIIVDDASSDGTREFIKKNCVDRDGFKVLFHDANKGKGSAIRTAINAVSGDVVIIQDADLEYDPQDFIRILKEFEKPEVQIVYGTRFKNVNKFLFAWHWFSNRFLGAHYEIRYLHHFLGIQFLNFLSNVLYGAHITDEATCYKAFRKEVLDKIHLSCKGFEFCPEVTAKARKAGYRIVEVPISYHPRSHQQGKKLSFSKHGLEAIWTLVKYRFVD